MWQTIVEAPSVEEFQAASPAVSDLEKDTPIIVRIDLVPWAPIGWLANVAGAEWWGQRVSPAGMIVDDVSGESNWVEITGHADPVPVVLLVSLIVAGIAGLGVISWMIANIKISADVKEREQSKEEFVKEMVDKGYSPSEINDWLNGIKSPPPEVKLPSGLGLGVGLGVVALVALGAFLLFKR